MSCSPSPSTDRVPREPMASAEIQAKSTPSKNEVERVSTPLEVRAEELRRTTPEGFTVVVREPFVVIGDEAPATVRRRGDTTVAWAVEKLEAQYFSRPPDEIVEVWLFKDAESYESNARKLFGDTPHTPYGYYSDEHDALIMNIATGGGTLIHEIVHPYMAANFPECPAWFNEGLASLYEQCGERDGKIVGLTNWRLRGLQEGIDAGALPSFSKLMHTTTDEFYETPLGYAQSRYLLYYLQEHGLLDRYWREFLDNATSDPSGYESLKTVLELNNDKEVETFQRRWERWVMKLTFP